MNDFVRDVDENNFDDNVIAASHQQPVLVDFWAAWCAPCRSLGPVLESLAAEYDGAFVLAKVDADANGALTQRFDVRGLPTVKVFRDGEVVDEFVGALPEPALREFLDRFVASAADRLMTEALTLAQGNPEAGIELLKRAIEHEPDKHALQLALAGIYLDNNRSDDAKSIVNALPANVSTTDVVKQLQARISMHSLFAEEAADKSDPQALRLQSALEHLRNGDYDAGLGELAGILESHPNWRDGRAREIMLAVFSLPEVDAGVAARWRRRLATLLH